MKKAVIHTVDEFKNWLEVNREPVMSYDVEGTSLKYYDFELTGFSLANGRAACYVDWDGNPLMLQVLKNVIENLALCIMHNAVFDLKMSAKYNIEPPTIFCTLVAMKLLNENLEKGGGGYGLKQFAHTVLGVPKDQILSYDEASALGHGTPMFYDYATNDAIWTFHLYQLIVSQLATQELDYVFEEVEMPFQYVLADLERIGVQVDKETILSFVPVCQDILFKIEVDMLAEIGMEHDVTHNEEMGVELISPVNFNSSQQLAAVSEDILGETITERTKRSKTYPKGQKSVDKTTIARLKVRCKFFEYLHRYRKLGTLYKNFLKPCEKFIDGDSRIRTSFNLLVTGRLSSSRPNLQNLPNPKKEKLEFNHRSMFIAGEGKFFVKADWSGQELRVLAEESQDKYMIECFNNNLDLHFITADRIFELGLSTEEMTNETPEFDVAKGKYYVERNKAKNGVNFPVIYGKTARTLAIDFNIPEEEACRWMAGFHNLYPSVQDAIRTTELELEEREYVTTMMGRRRRFPGYNNMKKWQKAGALRQAFNFKIQGFSAEMFKLAATNLREVLEQYGAALVLVIHDEIIYEVDEEHADEFSIIVKDVMENIVSLTIPILVEIDIVKTYGD